MFRTVVVCVIAAVVAGVGMWLMNGTEDVPSTPVSALNAELSTGPKSQIPSAPEPQPVPEVAPRISETGPYPTVVAPQLTLMFGRMEIFEEREHRFEIRNEGEAELQLATGETTCQCTKFELDSRTVAPGESTYLTMAWKPKSRDNQFKHGGPVFTNDPETPLLQFAVEGGVDAPIEMAPENIWDVGSVFKDQPGHFRAVIGSRIYENFEIESIDTGSEYVTTQVETLPAAVLLQNNYVGGFSVDVEVSPDIPSGRFSTDVVLDIPRAREPMTVRLTAVKQGMIRIVPWRGTNYNPDEMLLRMGQFSASAGRAVQLQLIVDENDLTEPFRLEKKESEPSFLDVAVEPVGDASGSVRRYQLTLSVAPGKPRVHYTSEAPGRVELMTNHPDDPSIVLTLEMTSS